MSKLAAKQGIKEQIIEAKVIRADGTVEDLGVVNYWHKSWWRRAIWKIRKTMKEFARGLSRH